MPQTDANHLLSGQSRIFIQDGISPANSYDYYGCAMLGGPSQSLGEPEPIYCPSPSQPNKWDVVGTIQKAQELGTTDFTARVNRFLQDVWWDIYRKRCAFNIQVVEGECKRPDQFDAWDGKIILRNSRLSEFGLGEMNALSGEDNATTDFTGSISFEEMIPIKRINFQEVADATILAEVLDGFFYDVINCGDCGAASDGCQKQYWLTLANAGSPGLSSQIAYTINGSTWAVLDIPTLGGLSGTRMAAVGNVLVVISQAGGNHHYSPFSSIDDGVVNWTAQSSGYVAGKGPRAIHSKSPSLTFVVAAGGYIYLLSNPSAAVTVLTDGSVTTQDLNDVHSSGNTVVAVGGSNAVLKSDNNGDTFSLVTGPAVGVNLTAVWCQTPSLWFVGAGNGKLYYTLNAGRTWTEIGGLGSGIAVINDIKFVDEIVGYMAVEVGGAARVYRTTDSGRTWQYQSPSINGLPTAVRINAVAPCHHNKVAAGGRVTAGGDGMLVIAE